MSSSFKSLEHVADKKFQLARAEIDVRRRLLCVLCFDAGRMRLWLAALVLFIGVSTSRPVCADGHPSHADLLLPIALVLLPSTAGVALIERRHEVEPQLLLTWQLQIPLGAIDVWGKQFQPMFRLVVEPIMVIAQRGVEFQTRIAPRIAIPLESYTGRNASAWARTALLISAGTTLAFDPIDPSLNAEIGITRNPSERGTDGFKWWIGLRGDAWLAYDNQYRLALMVGWSLL